MLQRAIWASQCAEHGNRGYVRIVRALWTAWASLAERVAWLVGCERQGSALRAYKLNPTRGGRRCLLRLVQERELMRLRWIPAAVIAGTIGSLRMQTPECALLKLGPAKEREDR
jgi:hypothetical protein